MDAGHRHLDGADGDALRTVYRLGRHPDGERGLFVASYGREGQHKDEAAVWADMLQSLLSPRVERVPDIDFRSPSEAALNAEGFGIALKMLGELHDRGKLTADQDVVYAELLTKHGRRFQQG